MIGHIFLLAIVEVLAARGHDWVGDIFVAVTNVQSYFSRAFNLIVQFVLSQVAGRDNAMQQVTTGVCPRRLLGGGLFRA